MWSCTCTVTPSILVVLPIAPPANVRVFLPRGNIIATGPASKSIFYLDLLFVSSEVYV